MSIIVQTPNIIQLVFTGIIPPRIHQYNASKAASLEKAIDRMSLTRGNIYEADYISDDQEYCYVVKNDSGSGCFYPKSLFKTLEEIRNDKLLKILSNYD